MRVKIYTVLWNPRLEKSRGRGKKTRCLFRGPRRGTGGSKKKGKTASEKKKP